jgi:uncharacterized protein with NAD-binding domain and iron-sulfur cluster
MKTVAIFGAGIAGLSLAHELNSLGYAVSVYEATGQAGGFFKSARAREDNMPSECSWHGMGPWYHNTFDVMRQIPFSPAGSLYDLALSRPVEVGICPDDAKAQFADTGLRSIPRMFRMNRMEFARWCYLMLKTWTSNERSQVDYAQLSAAQSWQPLLADTAHKTWISCFGPWIGSDWSKVSLHSAGDFFRKQLLAKGKHLHQADGEGPAWTHGAGDGWLLLKGPSSEYWFDPWVAHLQQNGVQFFWEKTLTKLEFDGARILSAHCGEEKIEAETYALAINPFSTAEILRRTPALEQQEELKLFRTLVRDGPHTQVSFRLAFGEAIQFPRKRTGIVVSDSEFNLTLFAADQVWDQQVDLGKGIASLWSGTSCISSVPGRIYRKPVKTCTKEEFVEEVKAQIFDCGALNELIKEANGGRSLKDFHLIKVEVWHEWDLSGEGIKPMQPKWATTTRTQEYLPGQRTPVGNLFLAGAHTRTQAQVWSIEGAVESGRRAAQAIDARVEVVDQELPLWIMVLADIDDLLFSINAPQVIDYLAIGVFLVGAAWLLA